jgi:hypothetical protein
MKRYLWTLTALGVGLAFAAPASAQGLGTYQPKHPTFSPYLNMTRGGGNPAVSYFGIVRPQMQTAQSLQQLQGQQAQLQAELGGAPVGAVAPDATTAFATGHAVSFLNMSHYFPPPGARSFGSGGVGVGGYGGMGGGGYGGGGYGGVGAGVPIARPTTGAIRR